jgi:hypothetical protein
VTASEAIQEVEDMLTDLNLIDRFGDPIIGIEAIGIIARHMPHQLKELEIQFFEKQMAPELYVSEMGDILETFRKYLFLAQMDKKLAALTETAS